LIASGNQIVTASALGRGVVIFETALAAQRKFAGEQAGRYQGRAHARDAGEPSGVIE
jgi:hypothetical protein